MVDGRDAAALARCIEDIARAFDVPREVVAAGLERTLYEHVEPYQVHGTAVTGRWIKAKVWLAENLIARPLEGILAGLERIERWRHR